MKAGNAFFIWIGIIGSSTLALGQSSTGQLIPSTLGHRVAIKKNLFPNALRVGGVKIKAWRGVFDLAVKNTLKRAPTDEEIQFQQESLNELIPTLVKDIEVDEDGTQSELEFDRSNLKEIKILKFKAVQKDQIDFGNRRDLEALIYCTEDNLCFIPIISSIFSYLDLADRKLIFSLHVGVQKKPSVLCPRFKERSRHFTTVKFPYPVLKRYRRSLLDVKKRDGRYRVTSSTTYHYHYPKVSKRKKKLNSTES